MKNNIFFGLNPSAVHVADDPNLNEEVSRFNLEWSPLLSLSDDMIDEDMNYTLMQINMHTCQCHLKIIDVYL